MTTGQEFNHITGQGISGSALTAWKYHPRRGWLANKRYADNPCPTDIYPAAGRGGA